MTICGVVAEFNPLHNGHKYLLDSLRQAGATHLVAVMSGNFVQRGEPAFAEIRLRTQWALACGCDLVIELPLPFAMSAAERFAFGAIRLLHSMGCINMIGFGSESGDLSALYELARLVDLPVVFEVLRGFMDDKITYARARQQAVAQVGGQELASLLSQPNNTLGLEYLRQLLRLGWAPAVVTIPRAGAPHDSAGPINGMPSASFIRAGYAGSDSLWGLVPEETLELYKQNPALLPGRLARLETAILARLRCMTPAQLAALPDLSEGLENRLASAIRGAATLDEVYRGVKSKRYTMARVRRLVLSAFLGLDGNLCRKEPPYLRVLGMNRQGRQILARAKESASLPLSTSLAKLEALGGGCADFAKLEAFTTDLYTLCLPSPLPCGYDYTAPAVFM